jgi:hypothetical protein
MDGVGWMGGEKSSETLLYICALKNIKDLMKLLNITK